MPLLAAFSLHDLICRQWRSLSWSARELNRAFFTIDIIQIVGFLVNSVDDIRHRGAFCMRVVILLRGDSEPGSRKGMSAYLMRIPNNFISQDNNNESCYQKHFLWMMAAPCSWNSDLVIHIAWKVVNELRMEPPIQGRNCRSGGPTTLTFVVEGMRVCSYLEVLSVVPGNMVDPPLRMTLA
jgi:hypothetical protein